jgi:hypothetical protein
VVITEDAGEGMVWVRRAQDALREKPKRRVKVSGLFIRIHFRPRTASEPGVVRIEARDGNGNRVTPEPGDPLAFRVGLGSRLSVAVGYGDLMANRLSANPLRLTHLEVTGKEIDTVILRSEDDQTVVEGHGVINGKLGVAL